MGSTLSSSPASLCFVLKLTITLLLTSSIHGIDNHNRIVTHTRQHASEEQIALIDAHTSRQKSSQKYVPKFKGSLNDLGVFKSKESSIIKGNKATEETAKMIAIVLIVTNFETFTCSGTILDSRRILTAAHCFFDPFGDVNAEQIFIVPALVKRNVGPLYVGRYLDVYTTFFPSTLQNDVAVVTINGKFRIPFTSVQLPRTRFKTPAMLTVSAAGFGIIRQNARLSKVVRQVDLELRSVRMCRRRFSPAIWNSIKRTEVLCGVDAANEGRSICGGDSGGPLFLTLEDGNILQIGISSFTEAICSSNGSTSWFTNLKTYSAAVKDHGTGNFELWNRAFTFEL